MSKQLSTKPVYLLSRSVVLPSMPSIGEYNPNKEFNVCLIDGELVPTFLCSNQLNTQSKTFAAPGDDDPDEDAEICY